MRPLTAVFFLVLLGAGLSMHPAEAEDEGSPSSVYLVFDEETGELVQVNDPGGQRKHQADKEAIASGTTPIAASAGKTLDAKSAIGVGVLLLLLFAVAWLRRSRANSSSERR